MVLIPPGIITLVEGEPPATVAVEQPFMLGQTTVTQAQWRTVMGTEPWKGRAYVRETAGSPVTHVSCDDALAFCQQLTALEREAGTIDERQEYGLPTEIQWELACRAGTVTTWSFGEDGAAMDNYGWYGKVWSETFGRSVPGGNVGEDIYPRPVGLKLPNPWGLYDMHGNIWEVCASQHEIDPARADMAETAAVGGHQVLRGGDCEEEVGGCRSAIRAALDHYKPRWNVGFRIVLSPP
jgi:formylglycine-generating enzyme required for sulfatase activity